MSHLSEQDKARIAQRIREIEAGCNAELVTVIAQQSDDYRYIPLLWAALIGLLLPGLVSLLDWPVTVGELYLLQIASFVFFALLFSWPPIKHRMVPQGVQHQRASRNAHQLFFIEGLHITEHRSGIMLFVSLAERYVEIIADHGINQYIAPETWQDIVDEFIRLVRTGDVAQGYLTAIERCGALLQQHYPGGSGEANELPDHLIEL